jgi:YkoY family integral membrane protein
MLFGFFAASAQPLFFDQVFEFRDFAIVGLLIVLEGVLSIDNALVLGLLARKLPPYLQKRALTYGLVGAFLFRLCAIATASLLLKWWVVKLLGGGYLVFIALKHVLFEDSAKPQDVALDAHGHPIVESSTPTTPGTMLGHHRWEFWTAVLVIELTDIAFAIDSILAAIALVAEGAIPAEGFHPKLWVIVSGGFIGVILMRFAAIVFIRLLERFPRFEMAAYLLVATIGLKLLADWYFNHPDYHRHHLDFHKADNPAFWVFWGAMALCFAVGFIPPRKAAKPVESTECPSR